MKNKKELILIGKDPRRLLPWMSSFSDPQLSISRFFSYHPKPFVVDTKLIEMFRQKGFVLKDLTLWDFEEHLDPCYQNRDTAFLMDVQLHPRQEIEIFNHRINIQYALQKSQKPDFRIWFYTAAGPFYSSSIQSCFPGRLVPVQATGEELWPDLDQCPSFQHWLNGEEDENAEQ